MRTDATYKYYNCFANGVFKGYTRIEFLDGEEHTREFVKEKPEGAQWATPPEIHRLGRISPELDPKLLTEPR